MRAADWCREHSPGPAFWRRFHIVWAVVWAGLAVPSVLWWSESVPWLVAMSNYACFAGHFSSWQAARIEDKNVHQHIHAALTWIWLGLTYPSLVFWRDSVSWVILMSVYSCFVGHVSGIEASRVEEEQAPDCD